MKQVLAYLLVLTGLLFSGRLHAAQAPKPTIRFHITYADENQKRSVYMILHRESDTAGVAKEAEQAGFAENRFDTAEACRNSDDCLFSSRLKKYHQIIFVYDGTCGISPDIEPDAYHSLYEVYVSGSKIEVVNKTPWILRTSKPYSMLRTVIFSLLTEVLVLWLVLLVLRYPDKLRFLTGMFLANLLGLPVFFGLMELSDSAGMWFVAELAMIAVETVFVWWFMKKAASLGKMTLLVFLLNVFSVFAGGAFYFLSTLFGQDIIQFMQ